MARSFFFFFQHIVSTVYCNSCVGVVLAIGLCTEFKLLYVCLYKGICLPDM